MIDDFLQGSNDQVFIKHILERAPTASERLFQEADRYITADERARDLVHPRQDDQGKGK